MTVLLWVLGSIAAYCAIGYGVLEWTVRVQPVYHKRNDHIATWGGGLIALGAFWPFVFFFALVWTLMLIAKPSNAMGHILRSPNRRLKRIDQNRVKVDEANRLDRY